MTTYEIILFFQCGWIKDEKNECLVPVIFPDHSPPAPDALLETIIDIPCSRRSCSYTNAQLSCTKFLKCYGKTCFNTVQENSDEESEEELELEDGE